MANLLYHPSALGETNIGKLKILVWELRKNKSFWGTDAKI